MAPAHGVGRGAGACPGRSVLTRFDDETAFLDYVETLRLDGLATSETIAAPPRDAGSSLPLIPLREDGDERDFVVRDSIGSGGMGRVLVATQSALARDVALKTVHADASDEVARALLQEARAMGMLEHPNVVPVHAIGRDEDGRPVIVMKRVEGATWRPAAMGGEDPLGRNLEIWLNVADAIAFAHSRGVIHRDLKPANIMIGQFGEVYVLDWGLAATTDREHRWLPRAAEQSGVLGTPAYMAPELASGSGDRHGIATDVYLLGALLFEILCGGPPHRGAMPAVLLAAYKSEPPTFGDDTPAELAAVCTKAMAREPGDRFESVAQMQEAVRSYLAHRSSTRLSARSLELLADLGEDVSEDERYRRFGAARFGFEQALEIWPDNTEARDGLQSALELMIERALTDENAAQARMLVAALPRAVVSYEARIIAVERAVSERAAELANLREFKEDVDPGVSMRAKRRLGMMSGTMLLVGMLGFAVLDALGWTYDADMHLRAGLVGLAIAVLMRPVGARWMKLTTLNLGLGRSVGTSALGAVFVHIACGLAGAPIPTTLASEVVVMGTAFLIIGWGIDARFRWAGAWLVLGAAAMFALPELALWLWGPSLGGAFWVLVLTPHRAAG